MEQIVLDYELRRISYFASVVYVITLGMVFRRAASRPLGWIERVMVRLGFPVYFIVLLVLSGVEAVLLARGVLPWPGLI